MKIDVPLGEVIDRITILRIKAARLKDAAAVTNTRRHLALLEAAWAAQPLPPLDALPETGALARTNTALWEVEDALRAHERAGCFDEAFVALARSVYQLNDERAAHKRAIDARLGSVLREEKSYG